MGVFLERNLTTKYLVSQNVPNNYTFTFALISTSSSLQVMFRSSHFWFLVFGHFWWHDKTCLVVNNHQIIGLDWRWEELYTHDKTTLKELKNFDSHSLSKPHFCIKLVQRNFVIIFFELTKKNFKKIKFDTCFFIITPHSRWDWKWMTKNWAGPNSTSQGC